MEFNPDITVIGGCGHVGLPLSIMLASTDRRVCALDINEKAIKTVNSGKIPFIDEGLEDILKKVLGNNNFIASSNFEFISKSKTIIIIIGTPVDEHLNPKIDELKNVIFKYLKYFKDEQLLVLRSTVYPGSSKMINDILIKEGLNIDVAFCPERIAQGHAVRELADLPQIISSFTENGLQKCEKLFKPLVKEIIILEPIEAELAKLFTNAWRYISFAIANQFFMVANDLGIDFYKLYAAMTYNYPRLKDFPKAGFAAGPCLFKDTMQIASFYKNNFFLGHAAMLINEGFPNYIVERLKIKYNLKNKKIGILGMTFKSENDDIRESLSFKLKKSLEFEAESVLCSDFHLDFDYLMSEEDLINQSDIIIIATPHKKYKNLDYKNKPVYDVWNLLEKGSVI
jgi:UDP-N-acetyl-D-mannosaminuronic acid dehydrogenase